MKQRIASRGRSVLHRYCLIIGFGALTLRAAAGWAETPPVPTGDAAPVFVPAAAPQEWMGPPEPLPAGLDPHAQQLTGEDPVRAVLWRAWSLPQEVAERAHRVQRVGLSAGISNLDAPARALLLEPSFGDPLERAEQAVALAPELPAAHAALAEQRLAHFQLSAGVESLLEAIEMAWSHLEARLWLEATGSQALFDACLGAALGFLALAACAAFPRFARDLRRLCELPAPSAAALALSIVLIPAALGGGLAGLGLGLLAFALVNGSAWRRLSALSAAALMLVALFPLLERRAESYAALAFDPLALAAWATEQGVPSASDLARVVRAAETDPFAGRALALRLARQGELEEASRRFEQLRREDRSAELISNSATVSLLRGDVEGAIGLYEQAAESSSSALLRFNLAQAYGRAIRLDAQDLALAEAQSLDFDVLSDLNQRYNGQDGALVAYLPTPTATVLERLHDPEAAAFLARRMRAGLAGGTLGESRGDAVVSFWLAAAAGLLFGTALRRMAGPEEDLYAGIARLLQARGGDSVERMAQLEELRLRQRRMGRLAGVLSWLVPGAAGMLADRPLLSLLSVSVFASGAALYTHRAGAVPDPLALGMLPGMLAALLLVGLALAYLTLLGLALTLRVKD